MPPPSMKYNPAFLDDEALIASFAARHVELELILETLRENTGEANQHLLLIGPRGIGKTTLVLRAAAEVRATGDLQARWYPLTFGEESYGVSTPGEFWLEALFHLGQQTQEARWQQAHEELRAEPVEERLRERALVQLMDFADEQDKRLLLIVENLNMLVGAQMSSGDAWTLRHTLMNEPRLMLLGTATSRFKEVEEYDQALYDLFRVIELDPLDDEDTHALWTSVAGHTLSATQIRPIRILTGGNPRLIRIISEFAADVAFGELMQDLIRLVDEHTEYFKHHLDSLPPKERKVFVALADRWDPSTARQVAEHARLDVNNASALLRRLTGRGAVTVPYKRGRSKYYQLAERMYNVYHLMRRRGRASHRVRAAVHFMTHLYRDERLVRTTRSLLEEAEDLDPAERRDHLMAYRRILNVTDDSELHDRLLEAGRPYLEAMPDAPDSVLEMISSGEEEKAATPSREERADLLELHVEEVEDTETLLKMAQALDEEPERLKQAEAAYRKVLGKEPKNVWAWHVLGMNLFRQEQHEKAFEVFAKYASLEEESESAVSASLAWSSVGFGLSMINREEEALKAYDNSLTLDKKNWITWYRRSQSLSQLGRWEDSLSAIEQLLTLDDTSVLVWRDKAFTLQRLERYKEALEAFDEALALDEALIIDKSELGLDKGRLLLTLDRHEEALEAFRQSFEQSNYAPYHLAVAARSLYENGLERHFTKAETWARRAVEQEPEDGWYLRTLAALLGAQGAWPEALSHAEAFLRDTDMVEARTDAVIDFFVHAAAAGHGDEALEQIQAAPSADLLEPLAVALRLRRDDEVNVAREIHEVARDVIDRIEARSAEKEHHASGEVPKE